MKTGTGPTRVERLAAEFDRLSEAVRSRNASASSEVQAAVELLAAELAQVASALRKAPTPSALRDEAAVQSHLAVLEARDKLSVLDDTAREALAGAARSSKFIGDTAKMKLALAKLDASDLFEEKRRLIEKERKRIDALRETALKDLDDRLTRLIGAAMLK